VSIGIMPHLPSEMAKKRSRSPDTGSNIMDQPPIKRVKLFGDLEVEKRSFAWLPEKAE